MSCFPGSGRDLWGCAKVDDLGSTWYVTAGSLLSLFWLLWLSYVIIVIIVFSSVLMMVVLAIFILRLNSKWCWKSCCRQESPDAGYVFNNAGTRHVPTMMKQIVCWIIYRFVHILLYTHKCVMHVCMYIYMHVCMYTYMHVYAHMYIYIHTYVYKWTGAMCLDKDVRVRWGMCLIKDDRA